MCAILSEPEEATSDDQLTEHEFLETEGQLRLPFESETLADIDGD